MTQYIDLMPSPASLIESLRSIGYSLEAAVADVIDNSVAAHAHLIDIRFSWNAGLPWLAIIDDGSGMAAPELVTAMRLGSISPLAIREKDDLGRFGLGLKTASFSQCRQLTVLSLKNEQVNCCQWDIDQITEDESSGWRLRVLESDELQKHGTLSHLIKEYLDGKRSGTIVLWEKLDRLKEPQSSPKSEAFFDSLMFDVRKHLELVFHRFLSPEQGARRLTIRMNNDDLEPFDPFNPRNLATQELPVQTITVEGEKIIVQPYVLPHHNKVPTQEYNKYAGDEGYLHNQGFYVYRNRRLIIKGSWFRLIKKDELNKLIRVRVDIPNTLDHLWKLDVKKSYASPPELVRQALQQVINKIEGAGRKVYGQRGTGLRPGVTSPVWRRIAINGTISYEINRDHPLIAEVLTRSEMENRSHIQHMIKMIENSFPTDVFFNDIAQNPRDISLPTWDEQEYEQLVDLFVETFLSAGAPENSIARQLLSTDPFASNRARTETILMRKGYAL
jgi:hypothetical protein